MIASTQGVLVAALFASEAIQRRKTSGRSVSPALRRLGIEEDLLAKSTSIHRRTDRCHPLTKCLVYMAQCIEGDEYFREFPGDDVRENRLSEIAHQHC